MEINDDAFEMDKAALMHYKENLIFILKKNTTMHAPKQGVDFNWQCWTHDPDGNKIELMQLSEDGPQKKFVKILKIFKMKQRNSLGRKKRRQQR